jgi:hypothetical protein
VSQAAIDTLRFANRLKEAGVEAEQAEAMARALGDELADQLATKADINVLKADISVVNAKVDGQARILNIVLAGVGLMVALGLVQTVSTVLAQ